MLKRSTVLLGLTVSGTLAAAVMSSLYRDSSMDVVAATVKPNQRLAQPKLPVATEADPPLSRMQLDTLEQDPFTTKSWFTPPPAPAPDIVKRQAAPAEPSAPPLPYTYLGQMEDETGHMTVYLAQGSRAINAMAGDTLDGTYHLDAVTENTVDMTYLPLKIKQTLQISRGNSR